MGAFRTVLLEGLFYEVEGQVRTAESAESLDQVLTPLLGEDIHLAVHFVPQIPIDSSKWGGGCCMWQPSPCPAGHHEHPDRLLNVKARGRLVREGSQWSVEQFDGRQVGIPLHLLVGHYGRVAAATVFDVQSMRESLEGFDPEQIDVLGATASDLREVLARLQGHLKRG